MRTIHKYPITIGEFTILMPAAAIIKHVGVDPLNDPCMWVELYKEWACIERRFIIHGTGQLIPEDGVYIGSFTQGPFVWHLYEAK